MRGLRQAFALLTRVPIGASGGFDKAAAWYPTVGALVGLGVAGVYALLYPWIPSLLAAVVAVGTGVLLTGAFHEDGLADSFDALGAGARGEDALTIMRDPRLGTYGTIALVFSLLWRVVAVASLDQQAAVAGLVMAHALGRAGAVSLMAVTPAARSEGLGRSSVVAITQPQVWAAVASGFAISSLAAGWWALPSAAAMVLLVAALHALAMSRFGGVTGDVLGAAEQFVEMGALAIVAGATWTGWNPWWTA